MTPWSLPSPRLAAARYTPTGHTYQQRQQLADRLPSCARSHHEINQFCSAHHLTEVYISEFDTVDEKLTSALQEDCDTWNTGIEILSIRVTKPRIPSAIQHNFEQMESEKTR
jgi:hypothetical protein